ncbi:MAG: NADH-quinone oxidoreductase subunit H [Oscillospiraceae bacterium]|nr:NADH-quinone oxidoreductase subunit H [Oscillospiraceae bacterium]
MYGFLRVLAILAGSVLVGGLLTGFDRVLSAKMQRRKGPPLLQPFYDVIKLAQKSSTTVNFATRFYITLSMIFTVFTVVLFLMGADLLLCIFAFTLAEIFFVVAGYSSYSPYSFIGTERELIQIMCYEPMILIVAFGFYKATGSFSAITLFTLDKPVIFSLPFIFIGMLYVLTFKLRKSPFDLSMSHHGHQELVKGITTELTGICMAMVEVTHWFETVFALGLVYIFFVTAHLYSHFIAAGVCLAAFLLEIVIDNAFARVKWRPALAMSWVVAGATALLNFLILGMFGG